MESNGTTDSNKIRDLDYSEREVLGYLMAAYNLFIELPVIHPSDQNEFALFIHHCQEIVMSRPVKQKLLGGAYETKQKR